jgi:penicillin-binding protein 1C
MFGMAASLALYARQLPPLDMTTALDRSAVVLDREGRLLRPFLTESGRWKLPVRLADVDPRYVAMLKAYEDKRFDRHLGVDPLALGRAAWQFVRHGRVRSGGSTLTMQVARLLEPQETRNASAKLRQVVRALELEWRFSKTEIIDLYLTLAPFGGNLEGVRAASLAYFGKEPARLSTAEAALLVALPQSPETRRPDRAPQAASFARGRVLARVRAAGLATDGEVDIARAEPVPQGRQPFPLLAPHAAEQALGERPQARSQRLAIDGRLQAGLEQLVRERSVSLGAKLSIAILAVDHATGEIRASVGGVDYFAADRAGSLDLTKALRSPGSALKPFIYALAFDNGIAHPETLLEDRPTRYGAYVPENFDLGFQGLVSARKALQLSLNLPAVELLAALGPQRFIARLRDSGADIAMPGDTAPGLAVGLGGLGITLHDLTLLYAGLARGGEVTPLRLRAAGTDESAVGPAASFVGPAAVFVGPVAAWYIADILRDAPVPLNASPGHIAFKTGTSYGYRDAWAVGFDKRHTVGVWVGRADNGAVPGLVGRVAAAPILFEAFARLGIEPGRAPPPPGIIVARTSELPPPLRHLRQDVPKTAAAMATASLRLAFPPNEARIDLAASAGADGKPAVNFKVSGGAPPFTWLVNGAPVAGPVTRRETSWAPDGAGFLRISVIDASGASDSVAVRLQ